MSRSTGYEISSAIESDLEKLVDLLNQLFSIEADFSVDPHKQNRGLALLLKSESAEIFVARGDRGEVIAMATIQWVISTAEGGLAAWVEDVVVDASHRGQGIGQQLLTHINRWAKSQGIKRLQLVADRDNRSALDFYNSQGWRETNLNVLRRD
ncbi:MAG: GNAT family N-acetyltransferase [Candidatus Thiodiazotropha sp.]